MQKDDDSDSDPDNAIDLPLDAPDIIAGTVSIQDFLIPLEFYEEAFGIGSKDGLKRLGISWDGVIDRDAIKELTRRQDWLSKTVSKTRSDGIRRIIADGIENGTSYVDMQGKINRYIGLHETGTDYEKPSQTIARTESQWAVNEGRRQQYMKLGYTMGDIDVALNACPTCVAAADQNPYPLAEVQGMLPLHPQCRCSLVVHYSFDNS